MPREIAAARRSGTAIRADAAAVSVAIPTRDGGARFLALLERLARQDLPGGLQLVVVDSGSRDGTPEAARAAGARVERVAPEGFQHGRTRNRALELCAGERVVLLTQDALPVGDETVRRLAAALDDERLDGAFARQVPRPGCDPLMAARLASWAASGEEAVTSTLLDAPAPPAERGPDAAAHAAARWEELTPLERYRACAFDDVASCVRRSAWEHTPFPEVPFGEDVAWAKEVLLAGGALRYEPAAVVEHSHGTRVRAEFVRVYRDHRNLSRLFGLVTVPSWTAVRRGGAAQARAYRERLDASPLGRLARWRWKTLASVHARSEAAAQFLGARAPWKIREEGPSGRLWRALDRRWS